MDKKTTTKSQGRSGRSAARTVKDAAGSVAKRTGRAAKNVKDAAKKTVKATDSKSGKADKAGKKAQKGGKHTARKGAARAVAKAPNCDTSPVAPLSFWTERRMPVSSRRCGMRSLIVRNKCVPSSKMTIGQPHSTELSREKRL